MTFLFFSLFKNSFYGFRRCHDGKFISRLPFLQLPWLKKKKKRYHLNDGVFRLA